MIITNNISKSFSDKIAVNNISFNIERGEVCGYLGANGAGKSTTAKILCGIIKADSGIVTVDGFEINREPERVKLMTGYVPESGALFESLTPYAFLEFVCTIYEVDKKEYSRRIYDFLELFDLRNEAHSPMSSFSKGMKQKVLIISSLIHNPEIIIWDEPLSGLDYNTVILIRDLIKDLSSNGKTFFYCSHLLDIIEKVCSRVIILNHGEIAYNENINLSSDGKSLESIFSKYVDTSEKKEKAEHLFRNL